MPLALLFLALAAHVDIVDQVYRIPADEWRYVELPDLRRQPALVWAAYDVERGRDPDVGLALIRRDELERLRQGLPYGNLAVSAEGRNGTLVDYVPQAGDYVLVVNNASGWPATVHLRIWLDLAPRHRMTPTQLSSERRLVVVLISLGTFCGIVAYAAWRMRGTVKR